MLLETENAAARTNVLVLFISFYSSSQTGGQENQTAHVPKAMHYRSG